jgi:nanoRNase/pAp phosphatase (c-di-AMP/oligoRNAs hydrolase)
LCLFLWFVFFKPTDFSIQNIYAENKPSINQETVKIDIPKTAETNLSNDDSVALVDTPQGEIKPQKDSLKTKKIIIEKGSR